MLAISSTNAPSIAHGIHTGILRRPFPDQSDPHGGFSAVQSYGRKEAVYYEGDPADHVFEVLSGVVKLYKMMSDGRCQVTGFRYPGQFFGLGTDDLHRQNAEVVSPATLCRYSKSRLQSAVDRHPELGSRLNSWVTSELNLAHDQLLLLGRKSACEKFCSFLARLSCEQEQRGKDPHRIFLPMIRRDIGDYLGLTTETVSRTVGRLKELSVIAAPDARNIIVLDRDRLEEFAHSEEAASAI